MRTMLLLGAGASRDADIPLAKALTEKVHNRIGANPTQRGTLAALGYVIGVMIADESKSGRNPYEGVDIERAFAAVRLLSQRNMLEVSPFVSAWDPYVSRFDTATWPFDLSKRIQKALLQTPVWNQEVEQVLREAHNTFSGEAPGRVYGSLLKEMQHALRAILLVNEQTDVNYLTPILDLALQQGDLVIATLNYDLTIEEAAKRAAVPLSTGVEELSRTGQLHFGNALIRLLKLHGSINWIRKETRGYLQRADLELDDVPDYTASANVLFNFERAMFLKLLPLPARCGCGGTVFDLLPP